MIKKIICGAVIGSIVVLGYAVGVMSGHIVTCRAYENETKTFYRWVKEWRDFGIL